MVTTVILGGGLSGIAAAYELGQGRFGSVHVVEKEDGVGGMERGHILDGTRFDPGLQTLALSTDDPIHAFLIQLMDGEEEILPVTRAYCLPGVPEPVRDIQGALRQLSLRQRSNAWKFQGMQRLKDYLFESEVITVRDAGIAQFGKAAYDLLLEPYYSKLWGANGSGRIVAAPLAAPREIRRHSHPLVDAFDVAALGSNGRRLALPARYLSINVGRICDRLIDATNPALVQLSTNAAIQSIEWADDRIVAATVEQGGELQRITGDQFISTIPLTELVRMLQPPAPGSVRDAAEALQFRSRILVTLFLRNPKVNAREWVYAVDPELPYLRYSETSQARSTGEVTPITFEYICTKDDDMWKTSDVDLAQLSWTPNQARFQTRRTADLTGFTVQRFSFGLPVHSIDYEENLLHIRQFLRTLRNLQLAGASSNFVIGSAPYSIDSGLTAARSLMRSGVTDGPSIYAHS